VPILYFLAHYFRPSEWDSSQRNRQSSSWWAHSYFTSEILPNGIIESAKSGYQRKIHLVDITVTEELLGFFTNLPSFLETNPKVRTGPSITSTLDTNTRSLCWLSTRYPFSSKHPPPPGLRAHGERDCLIISNQFS
jgi:hypothetical protein